MEEQNIGQGIQSLIPVKVVADDHKQPLEEKIEEKIKEVVNFNNNDEKNLIGKITLSDREVIHSQTEVFLQTPFIKEEKIFQIEVEKIKPNPQQPRSVFSEESIRELAASIREFGILEPLIVCRIEKEISSGTQIEYQLISGERRLLAAKMLGLETVPAIIRQAPAERQKLELALIENIQREDLTPIAKAKAFARLINEFGLTQQALAERIGKSREMIANSLRLLQLPYEAQRALEEGRINEGHGRALLLLPNPEKKRVLLQEILIKNLSGREAEDLAKKYLLLEEGRNKEKRNWRQNFSFDPQDLEMKEKLEEILKTPVFIKRKGEKGELVIKFFTNNELQQILTKFFEEKTNL